MALALKPAPAPYRDLSGGIGVDRIGGALVTLINGAEAAFQASEDGDGWRVIDWGDGQSATGSVLGVHGFTSNGGLGYVTASGGWNAGTGGANSISNPLAWFCLAEFVGGVATGRQITFQRGSGITAGGERFMNVMETPTACTGVATATAPRATGGNQRFIHGTAFGAVGATWTTNGANLIATATTRVWLPLVAEAAVNGRVALGLLHWDTTSSTHESAFLTLPLVEAAAADTSPWVTMMGTWLECFGGTTAFNTTPGTYGATVSKMHALDASGTWRNAAFATTAFADSTTRPGTSGNVILADGDGDFWLLPAYVTLDNVTGSQCEPKGKVCDGFKTAMVANSTHRFPTTLHSSVADADEVPRLLLGQCAITSELLYVPTWPSSANQTTWKSFGNDPVDVVSEATPPSIVNISPAPTSAITDIQTVEFDVVDASDLAYVAVFARYIDKRDYDVIWDGADFAPKYIVVVTETTVEGKPGFHFAVSRNVDAVGGWAAQGRVRFKAVAVDVAGNAEAA